MATFCLLAEFEGPKSLYNAAKRVCSDGYEHFDTYSPFPVHGMDAAMGLPGSKLGWIVAVGGFFGLTGSFMMQWWMSAVDYRIIISGKEFFSYPAFAPVTFELMVLLSAFSAVFGMFALNKLPQHYHPLFKSDNFRKVTRDGFFLAIEATDPKYDDAVVRKLFDTLGATSVEVIEA